MGSEQVRRSRSVKVPTRPLLLMRGPLIREGHADPTCHTSRRSISRIPGTNRREYLAAGGRTPILRGQSYNCMTVPHPSQTPGALLPGEWKYL